RRRGAAASPTTASTSTRTRRTPPTSARRTPRTAVSTCSPPTRRPTSTRPCWAIRWRSPVPRRTSRPRRTSWTGCSTGRRGSPSRPCDRSGGQAQAATDSTAPVGAAGAPTGAGSCRGGRRSVLVPDVVVVLVADLDERPRGDDGREHDDRDDQDLEKHG